MILRDALARAVEGHALDAETMRSAMDAMLSGEAPPSLVAALAIALRMRGETAEELAAAARAMRARATPPPLQRPTPLLDTCGTGGDASGSFNVSTVASIVVAACGARVAKHGNRAVSSRAGSADVLEALGVAIDPGPARVARCIDELGIGFLFAPAFHGALRHVAPIRRELGVRTFFNLLGPLANPALATHQLMGVYDPARVRTMAEVLGLLGTTAAWVVHGEGGLDEISPWGPTRVAKLEQGRVSLTEVRPEDFGLEPVGREALAGGDAAENATIARAVLSGERGPRRVAVLINAAAALVVAGIETDLRAAAERAAAAIDRGDASRLLDRWIALSRAPEEAPA